MEYKKVTLTTSLFYVLIIAFSITSSIISSNAVVTTSQTIPSSGTIEYPDEPYNPIIPPENSYTLTVNIQGEGQVDLDPEMDYYPDHTRVGLTAIANPGWEFSHWSGDKSGTDQNINTYMTEDKEVTAHFIPEKILYTLQLTSKVPA